jgi:hypothetical protein
VHAIPPGGDGLAGQLLISPDFASTVLPRYHDGMHLDAVKNIIRIQSIAEAAR